jgi:hypothetical protein
MFKKIIALYILIVCVLVCCAQRKVWQGQYGTVAYTTTMPKEDFKVKNYIVVAYNIRETDKYSAVAYRFDVMERGEKIGALEVCDRSSEAAGLSMSQVDSEYKYFLMAGETADAHALGLGIATRQIHRMYKEIPDYEKVKTDVINVLSE